MHAEEIAARRFALAAARLSSEAARLMGREDRVGRLRLDAAIEAMEDLEVLARVGAPLRDTYDDVARRLERVTVELATT